MNIKTAVNRMKDLEDNFICFNSQLDIAIMNCWDGQKIHAINNISSLRKNTKEIYDLFENGCDNIRCIGNCYNCQEIKRIYNIVNSITEEAKK